MTSARDRRRSVARWQTVSGCHAGGPEVAMLFVRLEIE